MDRLDILLQAGMIDRDIYDSILEIIKIIDKKNLMDEDMKSVFLIHVAMASQRIRKGEVVPCAGTEVVSSLKELEVYEQAYGLLNELAEKLCIPFPLHEKEYLLIHICNAFTQNN